MLEVLLAVKNNNVNKIPNYDPSHFEHLRKSLKSYVREGNFVTEMKIGLKVIMLNESLILGWQSESGMSFFNGFGFLIVRLKLAS